MHFTYNIHKKNTSAPTVVKASDELGVLNIATTEGLPTTKPQAIMLVIDTSASMSDRCRDGRTKFAHAKYTLIKMLEVMNTYTTEIKISIMGFDEASNIITEFINLNDKNIIELMKRVDEIKLGSTTNIECALRTIKSTFSKEFDNINDYTCTQIFMTDGEATAGIRDNKSLIQLVPNNVSKNVFIGYGLEHDSSLLTDLSKAIPNGEYRFIDEIENSGLVYGEILHSMFYNCYTNPVIKTHDCLVYDWNANKYCNELNMNDIPYGSERSIYVSLKEEKKSTATVEFYSNNTLVHSQIMKEVNSVRDCSKDVYKLKTMMLLYEASHIGKKRDKDNIKDYIKDCQYIKTKLSAFMKRVNSYIKANNMENNIEMKRVQDDIYIAFTAIDTPYSKMFIGARQISRGNERAYSTGVTNIADYASHTPLLNNIDFIQKFQLPSRTMTVPPPIKHRDDTFIEKDYVSRNIGDIIIEENDDPFRTYRQNAINAPTDREILLRGTSSISVTMREVTGS